MALTFLLGAIAIVKADVVKDDDVAWRQVWSQLGFDPYLKAPLVHRPIDDPWRGHAVAAQGGDEVLRFPRAERRTGVEALAFG